MCGNHSLLTRHVNGAVFLYPSNCLTKGAQQITARDFRAHSHAELKTKRKMRNADFSGLSGFVQGIHGVLFLYREIE